MERHSSSFRDPAGFVFWHEGELYRQVNEEYAPHYRQLVGAGLYQKLVDEGLLVPHRECTGQVPAPGAWKVLKPERIAPISYPYEWCFGQWQQAALLTLRVQQLALQHGLTLKDANAFNIQFRGSRPVLIDSLSLEVRQEGAPWQAYGQFCRQFLAPLALMAHRSPTLGQLLMAQPDGLALETASPLLPWHTWLNFGLLAHLHFHARALRQYKTAKPTGTARQSLAAQQNLCAHLAAVVQALRYRPPQGVWNNYYQAYTEQAYLEEKKALVGALLRQVAPEQVLDLGANTGTFAQLALQLGAKQVIALDSDHDSVEQLYQQARAQAAALLPLWANLAHPTPAIGWLNTERPALWQRLPRAHCALALALIHHLCIGHNLPLPQVAALLARLGQYLIIEFVPKADEKVRLLLHNRPDIYPDYHLEGFKQAFVPYFEVLEERTVGASGRCLLLMKART